MGSVPPIGGAWAVTLLMAIDAGSFARPELDLSSPSRGDMFIARNSTPDMTQKHTIKRLPNGANNDRKGTPN